MSSFEEWSAGLAPAKPPVAVYYAMWDDDPQIPFEYQNPENRDVQARLNVWLKNCASKNCRIKWHKSSEQYRITLYTVEAEQQFLEYFNSRIAPRGPVLVKGKVPEV